MGVWSILGTGGHGLAEKWLKDCGISSNFLNIE
jgi:hypothetical protein